MPHNIALEHFLVLLYFALVTFLSYSLFDVIAKITSMTCTGVRNGLSLSNDVQANIFDDLNLTQSAGFFLVLTHIESHLDIESYSEFVKKLSDKAPTAVIN